MLTNIKNNKFIYISIFCYLSLILGFILNEDSAGGALYDYNFHLGVREFFLQDTFNAVKNFSDLKSYHSPIFYIFLKYLLFTGETFGRLIFMHISILIPITFLIKKSYEEIFINGYHQIKETLFDRAWITSLILLSISHLVDIQYFDGRISIAGWSLLAGAWAIIRK